MRFQRGPTRVQWVMIVLLAIALIALVLFAVPEVAGIISPALEDTFSEWVWDLPLPAVVIISATFGAVGIIASWGAIHFLEGWVDRRRKERRSDLE